ncbi:hepatic sodium/bile acid cotransporter-like [Engraulis encrasicolus]|uniref:hepatic sodium/bile acid cotransporter-like n=1 Tax=Engraulis encrasicolus TaxID=184585 RepID=UPI002FD1D426
MNQTSWVTTLSTSAPPLTPSNTSGDGFQSLFSPAGNASDSADGFQSPTLRNGSDGSGFQSPFSPAMDAAISVITVVILCITMVSLGCTMEVAKIRQHLLRPKGVAIAVVAQFGIMPLTAFTLAKILSLSPLEGVTVLICGCCPGGNLSNIFSLALHGDMNLSIVMTTCSTVLALGLMPLLLLLYCQGLGLQHAVPYLGIMVALLMTLAPCAVGIAVNHYRPRWSQRVIKVGLSILLVSAVAIGVMSGVTIGTSVWVVLSPRLMAAASLMPFTGYTLGFILSTLCRLNGQCRRTIAVETGCQNIQLCSTILKVAFAPETIGPLYLFPLLYIVFQGGEALILVLAYRTYRLLRPNKEGRHGKDDRITQRNTPFLSLFNDARLFGHIAASRAGTALGIARTSTQDWQLCGKAGRLGQSHLVTYLSN